MRSFLLVSGFAALAGASLISNGSVPVDWLLLGATLTLDDISRPLWFASSFAWVVAALMTTVPLSRGVCFGVVMIVLGNAVALAAADHATLYTGFALMSLSAYAVFEAGIDNARRSAARVYLALAIAAEIALFAAMVLLQTLPGMGDGPLPLWVSALVIAGFGVKAGLVPLHGSLPLSYRSAPLPAGIILAGAAINCGILGWLRWLEPGAIDQAGMLGQTLAWIGLLGYAYAIAMGFTQGHPRAILGYSSISQMGLLAVIVGAALAADGVGWSSVAVYALFHAIAKTALFATSRGYPASSVSRALWWLVVATAVISLGGLTFTAGAMTKAALAQAGDSMLGSAADYLWLSTALSTALLGWFVVSVQRQSATYKKQELVGFSVCAAVLIGLCSWTAIGQAFDAGKWLISVASALIASAVVFALREKAGQDRAVCGDVSALAVTASFALAVKARALLKQVPSTVRSAMLSRLTNSGDLQS